MERSYKYLGFLFPVSLLWPLSCWLSVSLVSSGAFHKPASLLSSNGLILAFLLHSFFKFFLKKFLLVFPGSSFIPLDFICLLSMYLFILDLVSQA